MQLSLFYLLIASSLSLSSPFLAIPFLLIYICQWTDNKYLYVFAFLYIVNVFIWVYTLLTYDF